MIAIAKDLVSLLRDSALLLLAVLLLIFPSTINSVLTEAGFKEGNVAGFKWEATNQTLVEAENTISDLKKTNAEQLAALTEARKLLTNTELRSRITSLEDNSKAQAKSVAIVQTAVAQTIKTNQTMVTQSKASLSKVDYLVGLQTLALADEKRIAYNNAIEAAGYRLHNLSAAYQANEKPMWFAYRNTVLYYSAAALPAAKQLAMDMKVITGKEFFVQRGSGIGVDPAEREITLYIHLIK